MRVLQRYSLPAAPLLALALDLAMQRNGVDTPTAHCAAVALLTALWWVLQTLPMGITSLTPAVLLPALGVMTHREVSQSYGHTIVLLMMGGAMLSKAMEKSGAHRRLAVGMVRAIGVNSPRRLVLGFLLASTLLSMWISNTATALMLLPVALAVIESSEQGRKLAVPLLLAVAYGASVGGSGVPIGTPPNQILMKQYQETVGVEMSFFTWMRMAIPVVVVMTPCIWLWLTRKLDGRLTTNLPNLGSWRMEEVLTLAVFAVTALAWMTRAEPAGGWSGLIGARDTMGDSSVALAAVLVLFALPDGKSGRLLDWETARGIPWDVLLMMGGGFAIGTAFQTTQLSELLGSALAPLAEWTRHSTLGLGMAAFFICLLCTFTTEITSNTAVANVMLPILAAAAIKAGTDPLRLMLPATLGLNFAFMLPMATAPNAIVFGAGVPMKQMAREGLALNLIGVVLIALLTPWLIGA